MKRVLASVAVLALVLTLGNLLFAIIRTTPRSVAVDDLPMLTGSAAAGAGWPDRTHRAVGPPTYIQRAVGFGFSLTIGGRDVYERGSPIVVRETFGWPLPVLIRDSSSEPYPQPQFFNPAFPEGPGLSVVPLGLFGPPLALAAVASALLHGVRRGAAFALARYRTNRGLCRNCRYPLGDSPACPECGTPRQTEAA